MDDTTPTTPDESTEVESAESTSKWYELNTQKKKIAAVAAGTALAFGLGFGSAAAFVGDGHGGRHDDRRGMQEQADGRQAPQQWGGPQQGGHQRDQRGSQQWSPQQGQAPSMGPNSGTPSYSNGS